LYPVRQESDVLEELKQVVWSQRILRKEEMAGDYIGETGKGHIT
jgi:hypothetical protein